MATLQGRNGLIILHGGFLPEVVCISYLFAHVFMHISRSYQQVTVYVRARVRCVFDFIVIIFS